MRQVLSWNNTFITWCTSWPSPQPCTTLVSSITCSSPHPQHHTTTAYRHCHSHNLRHSQNPYKNSSIIPHPYLLVSRVPGCPGERPVLEGHLGSGKVIKAPCLPRYPSIYIFSPRSSSSSCGLSCLIMVPVPPSVSFLRVFLAWSPFFLPSVLCCLPREAVVYILSPGGIWWKFTTSQKKYPLCHVSLFTVSTLLSFSFTMWELNIVFFLRCWVNCCLVWWWFLLTLWLYIVLFFLSVM